jgi:hypothetical protein
MFYKSYGNFFFIFDIRNQLLKGFQNPTVLGAKGMVCEQMWKL